MMKEDTMTQANISETVGYTLAMIIKNAARVLKERQLPNHNAFTISEVVGAVTGLPKEYVMDKMMEENMKEDK